ncbi:hypothetical protein, partial [Rhodococcus sp. EPR-157]|uniref:hypothetical protein n=1 Tax=Rhodococcus sp. EPR-157 TaxID=1813677 RepID=UPI001E653406
MEPTPVLSLARVPDLWNTVCRPHSRTPRRIRTTGLRFSGSGISTRSYERGGPPMADVAHDQPDTAPDSHELKRVLGPGLL